MKIALVFILTVCLAACGSLTVSTDAPVNGAKSGIPISLPAQEFVITKYGVDKNGKAVGKPKYVVALVTKPDPSRKFYISHNGAFLASTSFAVERSANGVFTSVSGSSDENISETIQTIGTFVGAAAGVFSAGENNLLGRIETEIEALEIVHEETAARLRNAGGGLICPDGGGVPRDGNCPSGAAEAIEKLTPDEIKSLQNTLAASASRLRELAALKKTVTSKAVGERPNGRVSPTVWAAKTHDEIQNDFIKLRNACREVDAQRSICSGAQGDPRFLVILKEVGND